jgi:hypothetical protein
MVVLYGRRELVRINCDTRVWTRRFTLWITGGTKERSIGRERVKKGKKLVQVSKGPDDHGSADVNFCRVKKCLGTRVRRYTRSCWGCRFVDRYAVVWRQGVSV